jgi:hypothetical protein
MKVLNGLYKIQENFILIYREGEKDGWSDRCPYLSPQYNPVKKYNHRTILNNEIVIEYDEDDKTQNAVNANRVCDRLDKFGLEYSRWRSGNKSVHIHLYLDIPDNINDLCTFKRQFMRFFGTMYKNVKTGKRYYEKSEVPKHLWYEYINGDYVFTHNGPAHELSHDVKPLIQKILPDMDLASPGHPIRAEYGLHEKTGKDKALLKCTSVNYIRKQAVPTIVIEKYNKEKARLMKIKTTKAVNNMNDSPVVKRLLNAVKFREEIGDGRERLLWFFIHTFKHTHSKEDLTSLLQEWYHYSNGTKLSARDIERKVEINWNRDYNPGIKYLKNLCDDIGVNIDLS